MPRLPQPGSDDNAWGQILNEYLTVEHNADGTLKRRRLASLDDVNLDGATAGKSISIAADWDGTSQPVPFEAAAKSSVSIDGVHQPTVDLDSAPLSPHDLVPHAYSQAEVDNLVATSVGGSWPATVIAPVASTSLTTTTYTYLAGLQATVNVGGPTEQYDVTANLDVAAYTANTGIMVVTLETSNTSTGASVTYPVRFPVNGLRMPVLCQWLISGIAAGPCIIRIAAYLTANGNYQCDTGSTLRVQRVQ